ncbi:MAG: SDR family NAD(P)-dependent oxidoreductase [Actinomycetota bacterium]|nr:SDR family NAD(P)-dependent oxidoreductase [Actinomycetota bacterium]
MTELRALAGRVAIVTGAGRGIGRAHALHLASLGAAVLVNDVGSSMAGEGTDETPAGEVVAEVMANGGTAVANGDDVGSFAGGERIVRAAIEAFGRIDIVVNNAGIVAAGSLATVTEADMLKLFAVHCIGSVATARAALPFMLAQAHGRIVNTVSEAALDTRFTAGVAYGGAKGAVWAATIAMAAEVAGTGVTVNAVSPGARTRMNEAMLEAAGTSAALGPEHIARLVARLVADDAGDINGAVVHAAGGAIREYRVSRSADTPLVARLLDLPVGG